MDCAKCHDSGRICVPIPWPPPVSVRPEPIRGFGAGIDYDEFFCNCASGARLQLAQWRRDGVLEGA